MLFIVRDHVLAGRTFHSLVELDGAFARWLPIRRRQVHRTHGEVIAVRAARDRATLLSLPAADYVVADRHLRRVGKDCLVAFEASLYSVPAALVTPGMTVEVRATADHVQLRALRAAPAGRGVRDRAAPARRPVAVRQPARALDPGGPGPRPAQPSTAR